MEAFRHRGQFASVPSFETCIQPYKNLAREIEVELKLTDKQHRVASYYGFVDWQSFQYKIRLLHQALSVIDFTDDEWAIIYDVCNGWGVTMEDSIYLPYNVVDGDRYEALSHKWFNDPSRAWEDDLGEYYEPSKSMASFIQKIKPLEPNAKMAVVMKGLLFWNRTFLETGSVESVTGTS